MDYSSEIIQDTPSAAKVDMEYSVLNRRQVREVDRRAIEDLKMPGLVLMENAGRGCCDVLQMLGVRGPVLVVCGKGNNGGDGFVIARHLDNLGVAVDVALLCSADELRGDAAANFRWLTETNANIFTLDSHEFSNHLSLTVNRAEWIIDALLGTGASGTPRPPYDEVIRQLNASTARRLAVDIPSGLNCDSGEVGEPTFNADRTCTFVAVKPGMLPDEAQKLIGIIHVLPIGVPNHVITEAARIDRE